MQILTLPVILKTLAVSCLLPIIWFATGMLIRRVLSKQRLVAASIADVFLALFSGMLFTISLFAIIRTGGRSILLPLPILTIALAYSGRSKPKFSDSSVYAISIGKIAGLLALLAVGGWLLALPNFITFRPGMVSYYGDDQTFYATLSAYLTNTGLENNMLDVVNAGRYTVTPYHYGDIWMSAVVAKFTGLHAGIGLAFIVYPALISVVGTGLLTLSGTLDPNRSIKIWQVIILPLLILSASGFTFLYPSWIANWNKYDNCFFNYPKFLVPAVILLMSAIQYFRKDWRTLIITIIAGSLFYTTIMIPLSLAGGILLLTKYFQKSLSVRMLFWLGCGLFAPFLFVGGFYKILSIPEHHEFYKNSYRIFSISDIRKVVFALAAGNVLYLCCYAVHFVFIYFTWHRIKNTQYDIKSKHISAIEVLQFVIVLSVSGYISMVFWYNRVTDYMWFYTLVSVTSANLTFVLLYLFVFSGRAGNIIRICGLALCVANVFYSLCWSSDWRYGSRHLSDITEVNKVLSFIKEDRPFFAEYSMIENDNNIYSRNRQIRAPLYFLSYKFNPYICMSINSVSLPVSADARDAYLEKGIINSAPFSYYLVKNRARFHNMDEAQLSFLKENSIHYLFVATGVRATPALMQYASDSLTLLKENLSIYHLSF